MKNNTKRQTFWLIVILLIFSMAIVKGCEKQDYGKTPIDSKQQGFSFQISEGDDARAKVTRVAITAVGLGNGDSEVGPTIGPVVIEDPSHPLSFALTLFVPPCRYRVTIEATLSRDDPRSEEAIIDICTETNLQLSLDTFEEMLVNDVDPIDAPISSIAGETIRVSCSAEQLDAPDFERVPVTAVLREEPGTIVESQVETGNIVTGDFPDPHPVILPSSEERVFTCTFTDGRSEDQTFTKIVQRIPPTPTPTPTPTPIPEYTLTVNTNDGGGNPVGNGAVTSNVGNISCEGTCSDTYLDGTTVTLTAAPDGGGQCCTGGGWTCCDSTIGLQCNVTMDTDRTVTITYGSCGC